MGNCTSKTEKTGDQQYIVQQNAFGDAEEAPRESFKDPFEKEATETSVTTATMTPDKSVVLSSPRTPHEISLSQQDLVSPLASESTSLVIRNHNNNRALKSRLRKNKHMQNLLTKPLHRDPWEVAESSSVIVDDLSTVTSSLGDDPTATVPQAASSATKVWAELNFDSPVFATAFSRSNQNFQDHLYLAMGMESGSIVVQEVTEEGLGRPISVSIRGRVRTLDFSPNGRYLAAGGDDYKVVIYRLHYEDGKQLKYLEHVAELSRVDRVYSVQFSPDAQYLAIAGFDGCVAIMRTDELEGFGLEPITEIARDGLLYCVDWSPDSRFLAIAGSDKTCSIIDCRYGWSIVREIRKNSTIQDIRWFPTGKYLAIASVDAISIVVGRDAFPLLKELDLRGKSRKTYRNNAICWSPNGSYFVVCGNDQNCVIYDTTNFNIATRVTRPGNITTADWGEHDSGASIQPRRYLAIGDESNRVVILRAEASFMGVGGIGASLADDTSTSAASASAASASAANASYFSNRGDWVMNDFQDASERKAIHQEISERKVIPEHCADFAIVGVAFSNGGKYRPSAYFATSAADGLVVIRSSKDWNVIAELKFPKRVNAMEFSSGSRYLVLGCEDWNLYVSDTTAEWEIVSKIEFAAPVSCVAFSSKNNERLAVGSTDGTIAFLDPNFDFAGEIEDGSSPVTTVDWSSKNLAVGREDGSVKIYDSPKAVTDQYLAVADIKREGAVSAVAFGVNSRFLAIADGAGIISIYSSKGAWVLCHQIRTEHMVTALTWCPMGRHFAYGTERGSVNVMDTIFWADIPDAQSSPDRPDDDAIVTTSLAFSQDGKMLGFGRHDKGFAVMDSTEGWDFVLDQLKEEQSSSSVASSSSSSHGEISRSDMSSQVFGTTRGGCEV